MTREQTALLGRVLYEAVANSIAGPELAGTICGIIDAEIGRLQDAMRYFDYKGCDREQAKINALLDLKAAIEG